MNPTEQFLQSLEQDGKGPLIHRETLSLLLDRASEGMDQVFLDACFHAKFVIRTREVMNRIGKDGEGFDKLSAEFQAGVERTSNLLLTMMKDTSDPEKHRVTMSFLDLRTETFQRFLELCADLARIKNWQVDGRSLPFALAASTSIVPVPAADKRPLSLLGLRRITRLVLALFVVLLLFEGPVTILGWITAVVIVALLLVVEYEAVQLKRDSGA